MTPYRSMGRGTFILDRVFPGLGRLRRASGTTDKRTFDAVDGMLSALWSHGRHDYLVAIRDHALHPLYVFGLLQDGKSPATLPRPTDVRPLKPMTDAWLATLPEGQQTYHGDYLATFYRRVTDPTLAGLPDALRRYRVMLAHRPTQFNRSKYTFQAFLRVTVGSRHDLYVDVTDIPRLKERKARGNPFTPAELALAVRKLRQPYAAMCWSMALTGMNPKEYWGRWEAMGDRVAIHGTKREGRVRVVPRFGDVVPPGVSWSRFKVIFRRDVPGHVPMDLRRSFARWIEDMGIPVSRQRAYMGHGARSVTEGYQRHDVEPYLGPDGLLGRAWLDGNGTAGLAVMG